MNFRQLTLILGILACNFSFAAKPTYYTSDRDFREDAALIAQASQLYIVGSELSQSQRNTLESTIKKGCRIFRARYDLTYSPTSFMRNMFPKVDAICDKYF